MKVVYKFRTGQPVPDGAKYLCTLTEHVEETTDETKEFQVRTMKRLNVLVWHYYEVELQVAK